MKTNRFFKAMLILNSAFCIFNLSSSAQTTITFDTDDYKSVGVYDNAENSPLRKGLIKGNAAVVDNPNTEIDPVMGTAPNPSAKVLALQRSRFGSNTYGARIDLNEPFRVTKTNQYIHIMTLMKDKPVGSKMMVIGLGRRTEQAWSWQDGTDEQFWAQTTTSVDPGDSWQDVVCSFKGFSYSKEENDTSGIDIYSLIIVPDVRSPHEDAADWIAYIDQIQVDNSSSKRFSTQKYARNFDDAQKNTHSTRKLTAVGLKSGTTTQSLKVTHTYCYINRVEDTAFSLTAGETVTPTFTYSGTLMSGYTYVDWNCNGSFDEDELMSNSGTGNTIGQTQPSWTVPADTKPGMYRLRYKVDWDSTDPAGNDNEGNYIYANGGAIVDVMLDIHEADVSITANQLNGDMLAEDGSALQAYKAAYGTDFNVKPQPAPDFIYNGMTLKYGYNLNEDQLDKNGNPQWYQVKIDKSESELVTIPGTNIRGGEVLIEADMKSMTAAQHLSEKLSQAQAAYDSTYSKKLITENSQFSSPYTETNEGSLNNLLDGDLTTFWHSSWSATSGAAVASGLHYLQIELPDATTGDLELTIGRRDNTTTEITNDHLTKADIVATDEFDAETSACTMITTIDLPFGSQTEYVTADFTLPTAYRYIRIVEQETNNQQRGYWHCGEVQLSKKGYLIRETIPNAAAALKSAIDKASKIGAQATEQDVTELNKALQTYLDAINGGDIPTGISNMDANGSKGQKGSKVYDLSGRQTDITRAKGIIISDGKKSIK